MLNTPNRVKYLAEISLNYTGTFPSSLSLPLSRGVKNEEMEKFGGLTSIVILTYAEKLRALLYCIIQIEIKSNKNYNQNIFLKELKMQLQYLSHWSFAVQSYHKQNFFNSTAGCHLFRGVPCFQECTSSHIPNSISSVSPTPCGCCSQTCYCFSDWLQFGNAMGCLGWF